MKLVRLKFRDHVATAGWQAHEAQDDGILPAAGYLVYEAPDFIKLAVTYDEGVHNAGFKIWRACIVGEIEEIP